MAHYGSKGYYVAELKKLGIRKHPTEDRKLESMKMTELRNIYFTKVEEQAAVK